MWLISLNILFPTEEGPSAEWTCSCTDSRGVPPSRTLQKGESFHFAGAFGLALDVQKKKSLEKPQIKRRLEKKKAK